jgi:hypothetical protein
MGDGVDHSLPVCPYNGILAPLGMIIELWDMTSGSE